VRLHVVGGEGTGGIAVSGTISGTYAANTGYFDNYLGTTRFYSTGPDTSTLGGFSFTGLKSNGTSANSFVTILNSGNVGIGFTAPLSKLAIDGGLHVGGASDAGDNNLLVDGTITIGNTVAAAIAIASTHKVTMVIGGNTYYLLASNI
jgi:hypothetical protein